jgi:hypothetical protein
MSRKAGMKISRREAAPACMFLEHFNLRRGRCIIFWTAACGEPAESASLSTVAETGDPPKHWFRFLK